ncbi:bacitracin transport system permease protein [Amphibacillus marinus]|uniref:Bacitracin transport system permease protein n=1 Tax=Amphibacillus marinus TaxID=872970 RepID=A0A1H8QGM1_9BACI|nr:FtsX-like permease family protein [Amphibacillus marinus]SEO53380.1 bacitracin transport system permease protein [Amphibacillus marinus]
MTVSRLIFQNLKKNITNYYLYVFALVFSVALYFSFVTLQYDPSMDQASGSVRGEAGIRVASILLFAIVAIFLLYANRLFIKRRSREIGLFQLIGMNKNRIFRVLLFENSVIYFTSVLIGILAGLLMTRFVMLVLFYVTGVDEVASLSFAPQAFRQSLIVFSSVFLLILIGNYVFIKKHTLLKLFQVEGSTENKAKRFSFIEALIGLVGFFLIGLGYYVSQLLFDGTLFESGTNLMVVMLLILTSVILGTYCFFKGSIGFILNIVRKRLSGYLNIKQVMSLASIMFRIKSNALLLTIITTVSALAIGLLSLSYITYYSADQTAQNNVAADFAFTSQSSAEQFEQTLIDQGITYQQISRQVIYAEVEIDEEMPNASLLMNESRLEVAAISSAEVDDVSLAEGAILFSGMDPIAEVILNFENVETISWFGQEIDNSEQSVSVESDSYLPYTMTRFGAPVAIVHDDTFQLLADNLDPSLQREANTFYGFTVANSEELNIANELFNKEIFEDTPGPLSRLNLRQEQREATGLAMFIVGFLGLTFLITSGCILYFKQMDESESEKGNYTILRKIGYTEQDLTEGIKVKQLYNFGFPLLLGLSHSFFAVQSGWFFFGSEMWTPMLIVMGIYTMLYSLFGLLSVGYYKQVIRRAL